MTKVVGVNTIGYPQIRNFCGLNIPGYEFQKRQNINKVPVYIYEKITGKIHEYYWNSFFDLNLNRVDLFHFFNTISYGSVPWITTFETALPRWGNDEEKIKRGLRLLVGDPCKRIIALSDCAATIQRNKLAQYPQFAEDVEQKLMVLHPAQESLISSIDEKQLFEKVVFTIVGADFFRKGGMEVLVVFDRLYKRGVKNWRLNIVSSLQYGDYLTLTTKQDLNLAKDLIEKYPDNIFHQSSLNNAEVLELMRCSNVGLLPTYGDTYGYSVLEAQAAGCPVITTNVRALPEINNSDRGWVIDVPKNASGDAELSTVSSRKAYSKILTNGLEMYISKILSDPASTLQKGLHALENIQQNHTTASRVSILKDIYDSIVQTG